MIAKLSGAEMFPFWAYIFKILEDLWGRAVFDSGR